MRRRRRRRKRRRARRWYSSRAPRSSRETIPPATHRRRAASPERSPDPRVIPTTGRPRSVLRGTQLTRVRAGSRRSPSTPIDVCDLYRELASAARQDSKRRVTPTLSLRMNSWLTPGHLSACPLCQGSSGGNTPVNCALHAMKFLQMTIGISMTGKT